MQKPFVLAISTAFMLFLSLPVIAQEVKAAVPGPEFTVTAGTSFHVNVTLPSKATQRLRIDTQYHRLKTEQVKAEQDVPNVIFTCQGYTNPGEQNATLQCDSQLATLGGNYGGDATLMFTREETNERKNLANIRLPIVTVLPNPAAVSDFPDVVSVTLSLDKHQSLEDGSRKSEQVLNSLSAHVKANTPDSKGVRAYLRQVAEQERGIIDLTRRRYLGASAEKTVPIFFEDFDRRLKSIIQELGGTPNPLVARNHTTSAHLVLAQAQMPHTSDSVTVTDNSSTKSRKGLTDLVGVLTDAVKGLLGMSDSGTTSFHWSATTTPPGADIYISRLGEKETKWASATDVKDTTLEYAIWTFRFDWNGCSKRETPDPFLQQPIPLKLKQEGCRRQ